ncbi:MAG: hypothetical protein ACOYMF_16450 [Bacteroidales bacterium]
MTTYDSRNEEFIRRMVQRTALKKPSDDFTSRIMEIVMADSIPAKSYISNIYWYLIAGAASVAVMMMIFPSWTLFDLDFSAGTASPEKFAGMLNSATHMMSGFTALFTGFKNGSVFLLVAIALGLLFGIDQVLKKFTPDKHFIF